MCTDATQEAVVWPEVDVARQDLISKDLAFEVASV
jgi:hypothetical protein